jgi:hypothetical protein
MTAGAAVVAADRTGARRTALRLGAACGVVGPILALIVNVVHPRPSTDEVGEHDAFLRDAAESGNWLVIHLGLVLAFVLIAAGLVALAWSLADERSWLPRAAMVSVLLATPLALVQATLDTAFRSIAEDWEAATGERKETMLRIGGAVEDVDFELLSVEIVLFFGITFVLFGLAVWTSAHYPRPLGLVAVLGGAGAVVVGLIQLLQAEATVITLFVFPFFAAVLSLWVLAMSLFLWRRAGAAPPRPG